MSGGNDRIDVSNASPGSVRAAITFRAPDNPFDANALVVFFARELRFRLGREGVAIDRLLLTFAPDAGGTPARLELLGNVGRPTVSDELAADLTAGAMQIDLRAGDDAELLRGLLSEVLGVFAQAHSGIEFFVAGDSPAM